MHQDLADETRRLVDIELVHQARPVFFASFDTVPQGFAGLFFGLTFRHR